MIEKTGNIRSPKLCKASRDRSCVRCGNLDGTVVRCHYQGFRQQTYGKGTGIKGHDLIAADLCQCCHDHFDGRTPSPVQVSITHKSEEFLHLCIMTLVRDWQGGIIGEL